jgi:predicted Zn-dependent protease with MMP-like domain
VYTPAKMSNAEFDALEDQVDRLARNRTRNKMRSSASMTFAPAHNEQDLIELVPQAIDELPPGFERGLERIVVVVSDQGALQRLNGRLQPLHGLHVGYGGRSVYVIGAQAPSALPDRIVIVGDTVTHDQGNKASPCARKSRAHTATMSRTISAGTPPASTRSGCRARRRERVDLGRGVRCRHPARLVPRASVIVKVTQSASKLCSAAGRWCSLALASGVKGMTVGLAPLGSAAPFDFRASNSSRRSYVTLGRLEGFHIDTAARPR